MHCYANDLGDPTYPNTPATDVGTISTPTGGTSTSPTASLTLSNSSMTSSAVTPGNTAATSTNVTVNVSNAASYSLTLSFVKTTLTGTTTINAGNATTDNTWGYSWGDTGTYTKPETNNTLVSNTVITDTNGNVNFTKTLAFAAKFATNAEAGHYTNTGTLSLVASPKEATYTLADLTQMQQLAEGYAPDACKNTTIPNGQDYAGPYTLTDVRDNNTYTVYKFKDNKCWMTQNLKLSNIYSIYTYTGRTLIPTTSDVSSNWILPASSTTGFSNHTTSNMYYNSSNSTGYYSWCAATAGTCTSATSTGQEASSSICPKGWKLPIGGTDGEFKAFVDATSITSSSAGSTKIRGMPYNFAYTGYVLNGTSMPDRSDGYWWSRIAYVNTNAYYLYIGSDSVSPAASANRSSGFAVRCVAQ